jgi:tetratricopeptide (TPR) repeat protein
LKRALALQKNLPHAYSRLGTILAHIGLLEHSRTTFERGAPFDPKKATSHSITQVYLWNGEYELARKELRSWRLESPENKYAIHFALELAIVIGEWKEAARLFDQAGSLVQEEPMLTSLQGVMHASTGKPELALQCMSLACTNPKSFGHAHHTYYQIACILSLLNCHEAAFEWLERSVDTGFACWPFFLRDPRLKNLRRHAHFELLVSSLQAKYPDHIGLL